MARGDPGGALLAPLPTLTPLTRGRLAALEMRDDRVLRDFLLENLGRHLTRTRDLYEALRAIEYVLPRKGIEHLWAALSERGRPATAQQASEALGLRRGLTRTLLLHLCDWRYAEQTAAELMGEAFSYRATKPLSQAFAYVKKLVNPEQDGYDLRDTTRIYRNETARFLTRSWLDSDAERLSLRALARYMPLADRTYKTECLMLDAGELVHAAFRLIPGLTELFLEVVAGDPEAPGGGVELISVAVSRSAYRSLSDVLLPQELPENLGATIRLPATF